MKLLTIEVEVEDGEFVVTSPDHPNISVKTAFLWDSLKGFIHAASREIAQKMPKIEGRLN